MARGAPRKFNPKIPAHIDQAALPKGVYFNPLGKGRWYVLDAEGKKHYVGGASTKLSELHRLAEAKDTPDANTVDWLCERFRESDGFKQKAKGTRDDYAYCAKVVCRYKLKDGSLFGALDARLLSRPLLQRLVDAVAKGTKRAAAGALIATPSKAAHVGRFLGVLTSWGANRGHCPSGIGNKLELPAERADNRMPTIDQHRAIIDFAKAQGVGTRGKRDSVAGYLWAVAEIAYLCRLRGVEVCDMSEASATAEGLLCLRRKGSKANLVAWDDRLKSAWDYLVGIRNATWKRRNRPTPLHAKDRPLLVSLTGDKLTRRALSVAWSRMTALAMAKGVLTGAQRFGLHGLKHRGVTDTDGTPGEKQQASGHRSARQAAGYDHAVPTVLTAGKKLGKIRTEAQ